MSEELEKKEQSIKSNEVIIKLNDAVALGLNASVAQGFEKAFLMANATKELKLLLDENYMKPIMFLQGNKLGFKTDKDRDGGYSLEAVKNCLIEAVLTGVQPVGNQFNIIAGNCYITKEGFGYLLANFNGLAYEIIPRLPNISSDGKSANIIMVISWQLNGGEKKQREIEFPIKVNSFMGSDAVIGKATRKARAWLYNSITGLEIGDGDIQDVSFEDVSKKASNTAKVASLIGTEQTDEENFMKSPTEGLKMPNAKATISESQTEKPVK